MAAWLLLRDLGSVGFDRAGDSLLFFTILLIHQSDYINNRACTRVRANRNVIFHDFARFFGREAEDFWAIFGSRVKYG